ncbi:MAG TPA: phosphotransferase [Mobilitalea sp.]|nr:phosphotransferase [Mobilitalea sp.]
MNYTDKFNDINDLFTTYKIGNVIEEPVSVSGGLMHKMYKVTTETKVYAVKWLNPSIIQRDGVMENMIDSERIANAFSNYLPVVAALNFEGSIVLHLNNMYYMAFNWVEGISIFPPSISDKNCYEIGNALGKMHHLNISVPEVKKEKTDSVIYNWQEYYDKGLEQRASWIDTYSSMIDKLVIWNKRVNDANLRLSEHMVISHRDLDPKNVMWNRGTPYFIDWESAGYVNPFQELLEVLNYWSDNGNGELDKDKFSALLQAYKANISMKNVEWDYVLDGGYAGMLGWLEYSLKRALGMEGTDEDERRLGSEQILGTIAALERYDNQKKTIMEWLIELI